MSLWTRTLWGLRIFLVVEDASTLNICDFHSTIWNRRLGEQGKMGNSRRQTDLPLFFSFFLATQGILTFKVVPFSPRTYSST